jgi:hypothetical protein
VHKTARHYGELGKMLAPGNMYLHLSGQSRVNKSQDNVYIYICIYIYI